MGDEEGGGSLLRQTLMNVDECFVYKIPPMATSGGHRAEQWDLGKPFQTCGLQVERRDHDLYLLFTTENHTKLFAMSKMHETIGKSVEAVVDSSRYFVTHISSKDNKTAMIGFGFRERDVAIDLLGNLQQFQKSIEREMQAKNMKVAEIPKLGAGEKIHINFGNKEKSTIVKDAIEKPSGGGGGLLLLKKPPKFTPEEREVRLSMGECDIAAEHETNSSTDSEGAVARSLGGLSIGDLDNDDDDDDWGGFQEATAPAP